MARTGCRVGWYVRATLHELLGMASARLSAEHRRSVLAAFREAELEGGDAQINYNRGLAARFETIDRRLNKLIQIAFWITLFAALLGFVLLVSLAPFKWFHWPGHERAYHALHAIKPYFTVIMAFVPALIAAVHGVRFQMEFRSTAERTAATGRELTELAKRMADALSKSPLPGRKFCVSYVRSANDAMSADLAGWSNVYRGKAPEPPLQPLTPSPHTSHSKYPVPQFPRTRGPPSIQLNIRTPDDGCEPAPFPP